MWRYARSARRMWRSKLNDAVIDLMDLQPRETVVDIGAGVGAGSVVAALGGAAVKAVEPTPYMRRILGFRRAFLRASPGIVIIDGAAEATGLDAGVADAVYAVNTMHHWTDVEAGTAELARILAPGGRVVLADEDFEDPAHPDHERFKDRHGGDGHQHGFEMVEAAAVADLLRAAGLDVQQAEAVELVGRPVILVRATKKR